jgi:hypothetical protein
MKTFEDKYAFIQTDRRVRDHLSEQHKIPEVEHQKYLKSLPDDSQNSDTLTVYREEVPSIQVS